jgi:hypothetical protein
MSAPFMNILQIILGLIVLTTGRKLPWLFVAVIGFVFGMYIEMELLHMKSRWLIQIIGLVIGVIALVLGVYLKLIPIAVASIISGGYGAYYLAQLLGIKTGVLPWIFFVIGSVLGIILLATQFEWAVILLSSLGGATLVGKHLNPQHNIALVVFLALILVGVIVQVVVLRG